MVSGWVWVSKSLEIMINSVPIPLLPILLFFLYFFFFFLLFCMDGCSCCWWTETTNFSNSLPIHYHYTLDFWSSSPILAWADRPGLLNLLRIWLTRPRKGSLLVWDGIFARPQTVQSSRMNRGGAESGQENQQWENFNKFLLDRVMSMRNVARIVL